MTEMLRNSILPNWQVTATTVECSHIGDFVTILVYKDWSSKCTWWAKYKKVAGEDPKHKFSKDVKAKIGKCQGPDCKYVVGYRDKLIGEETDTQR
jgi:UDP-2,3-diacylglucosamine pyrophosphatase LpxH